MGTSHQPVFADFLSRYWIPGNFFPPTNHFFANWSAVLALIGTAILGIFISVKLFRWEKDEKSAVGPCAGLWPF